MSQLRFGFYGAQRHLQQYFSYIVVTINVNGLPDNRKRKLVFYWLVAKNKQQYNCICLLETHCMGLVLSGGKVNAIRKGAVLVHGYVDLVNRGAWLSF